MSRLCDSVVYDKHNIYDWKAGELLDGPRENRAFTLTNNVIYGGNIVLVEG